MNQGHDPYNHVGEQVQNRVLLSLCSMTRIQRELLEAARPVFISFNQILENIELSNVPRGNPIESDS